MRKICTGIIILITILLIPGCLDIPKDIIMPQWDVDLNVPIAQKSYELEEIIKNTSPLISIDPLSKLYMLKSDEYSQSVEIADYIKLSTASKIEGVLVPLGFTTDLYLAFPEGAKLQKAKFKSGKITIIGRNPDITGNVNLALTFPGITAAGSSTPLTINVIIPPGTSGSPVVKEVSLAGYDYVQPVQPSIFEGQLLINAGATISGGTAAGSNFDVLSSDFEFNSVTGYFPTRELSNKRNAFDLNVGSDAASYRGKLFLKEGKLTLKPQYISTSGSGFQVRVGDFKVMGVRKTGESVRLQKNDHSDSAWNFGGSGSLTELIYDQSNSNILEFIESVPDSIVINGNYILNPNNNPAYKTLDNTDQVKFNALFESKSIVAVKQANTQNRQTLSMKKDDRDNILNGQGASLTYEIENQLPLNVWIKVQLLDEFGNKLFAITGTTGNGKDSVLINSAQVNGGKTKSTITLDSTQIRKLSQAYFTDISVSVETSNFTPTNPPEFEIHANDMIKINTYGSVKYRVKEQGK